MVRAQVGSEEAFARLVERYDGPLLYFLRRLLPTGTEARDVLQEVWIRAWRKLPQLGDPGAFRSWLYRLARNRAVSAGRCRRPEVTLEELAPASNRALEMAEQPGVWRELDAAEVHATLERLSPPHREVLTLRYLEEMSYEEIAEVVACPVGTVRSRLHYAKKAMRDEMESPRGGKSVDG